jgi:hypothetical protein
MKFRLIRVADVVESSSLSSSKIGVGTPKKALSGTDFY